jgi:chorismate synthase
VLEKFGGDSIEETARNLSGYLAAIPPAQRTAQSVDDRA